MVLLESWGLIGYQGMHEFYLKQEDESSHRSSGSCCAMDINAKKSFCICQARILIFRRIRRKQMKRQRSSLSTYSKWRIEWRKARPNRTLIVISHRIASLDWLERYLVIEHGKIVETTSYEEMINKIEKAERAGEKGEERSGSIYQPSL
ncbi:hypothetical protein DV714_15505 [Parageobacillus thermoglucosidasius]|nr:hypothetical protein DV714_15505 [Parageobacillus thermoglucosidasius]